MLEVKKYSKPEMTKIFGTKNMQGLERKLKRYGVIFDRKGRGEKAIFTIKEITNPLRVYLITELGFNGQHDYIKVRNFLYYFFNDEEFMAMPDEVKEARMKNDGNGVSRQAIAGYIAKLDGKNLIERNTNNYIYYFAYKQNQRIVDRDEYIQAWHEYWADIDMGLYSGTAINKMRNKYGGVARKQAIPEINGIYKTEVEYLNTLIVESIEKEIEEQN